MHKLNQGEFYGDHYQKLIFDDFTITDTEYTHDKVDWHFHETPYFTYLLEGRLFEANKKEGYYLKPGSLLFHNWQDAHYNIKPQEYTRGFHIELSSEWFSNHDLKPFNFEGSVHLQNPMMISAINKIVLESKKNDPFSKTSIDSSILYMLSIVQKEKATAIHKMPAWVKTLKEILIEDHTCYSLNELSKKLNIHPVHLSRAFHQMHGVTFGEYTRQIKLNKAIHLMRAKRYTLTQITHRCGFYDQSHFIKAFKRTYQTTPSEMNNLLDVNFIQCE